MIEMEKYPLCTCTCNYTGYGQLPQSICADGHIFQQLWHLTGQTKCETRNLNEY